LRFADRDPFEFVSGTMGGGVRAALAGALFGSGGTQGPGHLSGVDV
jgi:hypothetical protein